MSAPFTWMSIFFDLYPRLSISWAISTSPWLWLKAGPLGLQCPEELFLAVHEEEVDQVQEVLVLGEHG